MIVRHAPPLIAALLLAGCSPPPLVVQGEAVSYDSSTRVLVVRDERSGGTLDTFDLSKAEIGVEPKPGDTVRIAYHSRDTLRQATRVMNLTRQAELRGGH